MIKLKNVDLYNDNIGFVESWDFSEANMSAENRVDAVTKIASICYGKEAKNKISLFNMLESESIGLPSSAFEFVPVLINQYDCHKMASFLKTEYTEKYNATLNIEKYGEWVEDGFGEEFLLTNLRACLNDQSKYEFDFIDLKEYFNTDLDEIHIIRQNFKVFYEKIPLFVARQLVRHRMSYQELSRRYTDDKSSPIEFYVKKDINKKENTWGTNDAIKESVQYCLDTYNFLIKKGMEPEDARAVLPTAMYTKLWSSFTPSGYDNFIKLRTKKNAQSEIRDLANAMEELCLTKQN